MTVFCFGAFAELEPGVEGLLPLSELPVGAGAQINRWLWIDDWAWVRVLLLYRSTFQTTAIRVP